MSNSEEFSTVLQEWNKSFMQGTMHAIKNFMSENKISFTQASLLMRLYHGGKIGVSDLGEHLGITNPATSQAIDPLVKDGYLERTEDPEDRRVKRLALTPRGVALIEQGLKLHAERISRLEQSLSGDQRKQVVSALKILTEAANKLRDQ